VTWGRTQELLAKEKIETGELVDARKTTLKLKDACALLEGMDELVAAAPEGGAARSITRRGTLGRLAWA
jgi:hypothetical protein